MTGDHLVRQRDEVPLVDGDHRFRQRGPDARRVGCRGVDDHDLDGGPKRWVSARPATPAHSRRRVQEASPTRSGPSKLLPPNEVCDGSDFIRSRTSAGLRPEPRSRARRDLVSAGKTASLKVMGDITSNRGAVAVLRDGRYEGGNGNLFVELRRDVAGTAAMSADLYRTQTTGRDYVASVRTAPGTHIDPSDSSWPAIWQDSLGDTTTGTLQVTGAPQSADAVIATFVVDRRINGLPPHVNLVVAATWVGDEIRAVGVEMETEETVVLPSAVPFDGTSVDIRECLRRAGFAVRDAGLASRIPRQPGGWNLSVTFSILHDLMTSTAQASLATGAWELHLLMLTESTRDGLLGIMFDTGDALPRQGAAVFVDEIRSPHRAPGSGPQDYPDHYPRTWSRPESGPPIRAGRRPGRFDVLHELRLALQGWQSVRRILASVRVPIRPR